MTAHRNVGNSQPFREGPEGQSPPGTLFWVLALIGTVVTAIVMVVWLRLPVWILFVIMPLAMLRVLATDEIRRRALRRYFSNQDWSNPPNEDHSTDAKDEQ